MDAADITIAKMKEATKWRVPPRQVGCYSENNPNGNAWWKDKDAYMKANGYPITTKQIRLGNTAADRTNAMDQLIKEMDAKQDIESSGGGTPSAWLA